MTTEQDRLLQAHELALIDYYDYLSDPAGWFVKKEHPSLDGG